jgi:hypothetical protein
VLSVASAKGPLSAARKYGDWLVRRELCIRKGVALEPMRSVLVFVKSDRLALCYLNGLQRLPCLRNVPQLSRSCACPCVRWRKTDRNAGRVSTNGAHGFDGHIR